MVEVEKERSKYLSKERMDGSLNRIREYLTTRVRESDVGEREVK